MGLLPCRPEYVSEISRPLANGQCHADRDLSLSLQDCKDLLPSRQGLLQEPNNGEGHCHLGRGQLDDSACPPGFVQALQGTVWDKQLQVKAWSMSCR